MEVYTKYFFFFFLLTSTNSQLISPCPSLFNYDQLGFQNGTWFATIRLFSEFELKGVWLRLIFDKPSIQLGNWFGEVLTLDNKEYLIKKPTHILPAYAPLRLNFFLKYNPNETPPQLTSFRLNGRTLCPEKDFSTEVLFSTGQLFTSNILSTTGKHILVHKEEEKEQQNAVINSDQVQTVS